MSDHTEFEGCECSKPLIPKATKLTHGRIRNLSLSRPSCNKKSDILLAMTIILLGFSLYCIFPHQISTGDKALDFWRVPFLEYDCVVIFPIRKEITTRR
ncbi:hypothetical protein Naga_100038g46 [Nannochloropsis gaditana]|uniref:Uncharacterized protein n=1 Tax=Nannochloropsis gaditana TaxID=72520 RepID=W7TJK7_9STRA|nr:hypothetical protein Naga_100038g46 [Nannochloropsis gaditana]